MNRKPVRIADSNQQSVSTRISLSDSRGVNISIHGCTSCPNTRNRPRGYIHQAHPMALVQVVHLQRRENPKGVGIQNLPGREPPDKTVTTLRKGEGMPPMASIGVSLMPPTAQFTLRVLQRARWKRSAWDMYYSY